MTNQINMSAPLTAPLSSSLLLHKYNENIDLSLRTSDMYQLAIKHYLNKSFLKSWNIITEILQSKIDSIDDELVVKVYKLYLSLYDLIMKSDFDLPGRPILVTQFQNGILFNDIKSLQLQNYELFLICFIIEKANGLDLQILSNQIDQALLLGLEKDKYRDRIVRLYAFNVLCELDQFQDLEAVLYKYSNSEEELNSSLAKLKQYKETKAKERIELQRAAELSERELRKARELKEQSALESQRSNNNVVEKHTTVTDQRSTRSDFMTIVEKYRRLGLRFYRQNNNMFMLLLLLIGFLISLRKKRNMVMNTLKMIFKVSYL